MAGALLCTHRSAQYIWAERMIVSQVHRIHAAAFANVYDASGNASGTWDDYISWTQSRRQARWRATREDDPHLAIEESFFPHGRGGGARSVRRELAEEARNPAPRMTQAQAQEMLLRMTGRGRFPETVVEQDGIRSPASAQV